MVLRNSTGHAEDAEGIWTRINTDFLDSKKENQSVFICENLRPISQRVLRETIFFRAFQFSPVPLNSRVSGTIQLGCFRDSLLFSSHVSVLWCRLSLITRDS